MKSDLNINFDQFLSTQLNPQQHQAVTHKDGPLLIIAGAGSGKTRIITARITHLMLNQDVRPDQILALTFTNKAAKEMRERILQFVGLGIPIPFIGTFHSFGLYLLKKYPQLLAVPFASILDADDQQKMLSGIVKRMGINNINAKQAGHHISQIKNNSLRPDISCFDGNPLLGKIFQAYEQEKRLSHCYDFDDLLLRALHLFQDHKEFATQFQHQYRHILVDEYQDTNVVQHELLKLMASNSKKECVVDSLCAVGDEDQSIYSWRGATVTNIMNFSKDFKNTTMIKVEQNYRSVQPILNCANHLINHNVNRNPKKLWSDRPASDRIRIINCMSEYHEGQAIATFLKKSRDSIGYKKCAILYRAHYQSRAIEEALIKESIPYTIIAGVQFYERKEIKDLLAYLRLVINPYDRTSLLRIVNVPARSLGTKFEEDLLEHWNVQPLLPFDQLLGYMIEKEIIKGVKKSAVQSFISIFSSINHETAPATAIQELVRHINYYAYLQTAYDKEEAHSRIENVKELISALEHFQTQGVTTIGKFLDEVALMQEHKKKDDSDDRVTLMTLHAAKGLEFDTIILAGIEEGILPSSRSLISPEMIEEERRLFYVGITRAQERLLLTRSQYRSVYGTTNTQSPSRFLDEIPSTITQDDGRFSSESQLRSYFSQWLNSKTEKNSVLTFGVAKQTQSSQAQEKKDKKSIHIRWQKNQPVTHESFGLGLIKTVETKQNGDIYLSIAFKKGTKKVKADFVKPS